MKILFYYPCSLRNRRRGTPLRVYAIYESLRKLADVYLVAREVLPPSSVGEVTLRLYGTLSYSHNSARDLRCAPNGA